MSVWAVGVCRNLVFTLAGSRCGSYKIPYWLGDRVWVLPRGVGELVDQCSLRAFFVRKGRKERGRRNKKASDEGERVAIVAILDLSRYTC